MIKFEKTDVMNFENAVRGARNPMNSWDKSDSGYIIDCKDMLINQENCYPFMIGKNDLALLKKLVKAGSDHRKFMRQIFVSVDITAPLYWWKEFDTYKVGTVANSTSTMHRLTHKPFEMSDFSFERLAGYPKKEYFDVDEDFEEIFVTVKGHERYSVSNKGRVYSRRRKIFLQPSVNSANYKKVVLNGINYYVHRLVAEAFCENPNSLDEVNHKDGNKWNNNYTNLEWVSKSENAKHAVSMGLRTVSGYTRYRVACSAHRFSAQEIEEIRQMYNDGMTKQEISDKIGCSSSTICYILNGQTYREIEMTPYDTAKVVVDTLNELREIYLETKDKEVWYEMIQMLPSSYNQLRTVTMNYENLMNIYYARRNHKLDEWHEVCRWIETLPYAKELICFE